MLDEIRANILTEINRLETMIFNETDNIRKAYLSIAVKKASEAVHAIEFIMSIQDFSNGEQTKP